MADEVGNIGLSPVVDVALAAAGRLTIASVTPPNGATNVSTEPPISIALTGPSPFTAAELSNEPELKKADIVEEMVGTTSRPTVNIFSPSRGPDFSLDTRLAAIEQTYIEDALRDSDGVQRQAAKLLEVTPQSLSKKIRRLGIDVHR